MAQRRKKRRGERSTRDRFIGRSLRVQVKTARGRKVSSTRWLDRQLNDPYVKEAQRLGYRSRAAFKLLQIDEKFQLFRAGHRVVDLGAAPGGWTQIAVKRVQSDIGSGRVVAIDTQEMDPITGSVAVCMDAGEALIARVARDTLGGPADIVLSDMAASITGHKATDHLRTVVLCELAHTFAVEVLKPGGSLVMKAFDGGAHQDLTAQIKQDFDKTRTVKPDASRPESPETYIVASGFRRRE